MNASRKRVREVHTRDYRSGTISGDSAEAVDEAVRSLVQRDERERRTLERWGTDRMERLCASFHVLRGADGTAPWDADKFLAWACNRAHGSGARHAARFVLSVWNNRADWDAIAEERHHCNLGRFDAIDAIAGWDADNVAAFVAWAELPFWP